MAKTKSKKKGLSDLKSEAHLSKKKKSMNPFEVHVNRQKFNVLGRTLKTDRGLPGLSRAKSIKKRKETLLQEYKGFGKSNKFDDRRIGEFNKDMTADDKLMARFAAERASSHKKKAMFNLAEDEPLTHKGRSIMELETFEDPPSDGEDDFFDRKLDGAFVEEAHFGGGMLKKTEGSRMAVIDQLIADSKKRKAEKAAAKEQTAAATEKLDSEWRDLLPVLAAGKPVDDDLKKDDYDKILGSLRLEPRGTPSDRLKSENEVAEEEAKRLRQLEEDRLRRMTGETVPTSKKISTNHRSADDLDDGFDLSDDGAEEDFELMYDKEGNLVGLPKEQKKDSTSAGVEESDEAEGGDGSSDEDEDEDSEDDFSDMKLHVDDGDDDDGDAGGGDDDDDPANEKDSDEVPSGKRSKRTLDGDDDDTVEKSEALSSKLKKRVRTEPLDVSSEETSTKWDESSKKKVSFSSEVGIVSYDSEEKLPKSVEELEKMRKDEKLMATARNELPYTFLVPNEYEEFQELMKDRTLVQQMVIIERMIKCSHPSLKEGNREKLESLFTFILQRLNDCDYTETWASLDAFAPYLFDLNQFSPTHVADSISEVLAEKFGDYIKKKHHYPYPDTLVFLKLVPMLFPPSDKRHQVTTPAFAFILSILHTCRPTTRRGISCGLFLCALLTQYVSLSKRIAPEAISYLNSIFQMAIPKVHHKSTVVPPFMPEYKFLCLESDLSSFQGSCKMSLVDLGYKGTQIDDEFRVRAVFSALVTLGTFSSLYSDKPAAFLLFEPLCRTLQSFKVILSQAVIDVKSHECFSEILSFSLIGKKQILQRYPPQVAEKLEEAITTMDLLRKKGLSPLVKDASRPKMLRTYEPNIKPVFDQDKMKDERIRMKRRLKKETKGALREIRKDRTFLAGVRYKEQQASDVERIRKVKEIYGWGAQQQGELNKMDRIKKRKKFRK